MLYRSNKIYVDDSPVHGRGVFASEKIKKGEILEECHYIEMPHGYDYPWEIRSHFFSLPKGGEGMVVCLGYGSIFNHSYEGQNANWETSPSERKFIFFATREINPGEEIFTNYQNEEFP